MSFHFKFNNPYTATRLPLFARNLVSISGPLAAQTGHGVLYSGGNTVDVPTATPGIVVLSPEIQRS